MEQGRANKLLKFVMVGLLIIAVGMAGVAVFAVLARYGDIGVLRVNFLPSVIMLTLSIALAAWATRLLIFFAFRIVRGLDGEENPHEGKETMGLPKGAVRTFLALTFTSIATLALFTTDSSIIRPEDKKWLLGELGVVIAFYFGSKAVETFVDSRIRLGQLQRGRNPDDQEGR